MRGNLRGATLRHRRFCHANRQPFSNLNETFPKKKNPRNRETAKILIADWTWRLRSKKSAPHFSVQIADSRKKNRKAVFETSQRSILLVRRNLFDETGRKSHGKPKVEPKGTHVGSQFVRFSLALGLGFSRFSEKTEKSNFVANSLFRFK